MTLHKHFYDGLLIGGFIGFMIGGFFVVAMCVYGVLPE